MPQHLYISDEPNDKLLWAHEGMTVIDSEGREVGKVKYVQFAQKSEEPAFVMPDAFYRLREEVQKRLMRVGFIQIDCGASSQNRFATCEQIAGKTYKGLRLNVREAQLARA